MYAGQYVFAQLMDHLPLARGKNMFKNTAFIPFRQIDAP